MSTHERKKWIAIDFDGTLAQSLEGEYDPREHGPAIPAMVDRVKVWLEEGEDIRIFTARVSPSHSQEKIDQARATIEEFCLTHFGVALPVVHCKDHDTGSIYDDIAVSVEHDTGQAVSANPRPESPDL